MTETPPPAQVLNTALSQRDRLRAAPAHATAPVDGRSLAQLIAFAADYGSLITFYDLDNQPDGDWSAFFAADEAVGLAMHAALDLPQIEAASRRLLALARDLEQGRERHRHLRRVMAAIGRLLAILDRGRPGAQRAKVRVKGSGHAAQADALAGPMAALYAHLGARALDEALSELFEDRPDAWLATLADVLEDVLAALISELKRGVAQAQSGLKASLEADTHTPQAALWNAFAMLFDHARGQLNTFSARLIDFYYGDVLKQHDVAARPDQLFLTFTTAAKVDWAAVPKGAIFSAGADAKGASIDYATDASLDVQATAVQALTVHRVTAVGASADQSAGVLTGAVDLAALLSGEARPFPMFGVDKEGPAGALTMKPASLGFLVSSQTLMLTGGSRTITLVFDLDFASVGRAMGAMRQPAARDDPLAGLVGIINTDFKLYYSTAGGWVSLPDFKVSAAAATAAGAPYTVTVTIALAANAPPLVALSTPPAQGAPAPSLPAAAFKAPDAPSILAQWSPGGVKSGASIQADDAFAIISQIELLSLAASVSVTDLTSLAVLTPTGPADPAKPMFLFGPAPAQYAELDLAAPELFVKAMDSVSVSIRWSGVPVTTNGFTGYYQGYLLDADGVASKSPLFDNAKFLVSLSVGAPGGAAGPVAGRVEADPGAPWSVDPTTSLTLFQTAAGASAVAGAPVNPVSQLVAPKVTKAAPARFFDPKTCALRITLVAPIYAFGHVLYSSNLLHGSLAQTRAAPGRWPWSPKPAPAPAPVIPNAPWAPTASGVSISYTASTQVALQPLGASVAPSDGAPAQPQAPTPTSAVSRGQFLHLRPFDHVQPPVAPDGTLGLLPQVETFAALYVTLSAPVPAVSLLFILAPTEAGWSTTAPHLLWQQWIDGAWQNAAVVADGSGGLTSSGVVQLALGVRHGAKATDQLRVLAVEGHQHMPLVSAVVANAVTASWTGPGGAATRGTPLPAGTIAAVPAALAKAGVGAVDQPMQSVGGSPLATGGAFQLWMAERLRHKGFAIDAWDYAHLVLEQTPSIWQAAVVPATDAATGAPAPGRVWIVVVAGRTTPDVTDETTPSVSPALLHEVGAALAKAAGPFVQIAVTNPLYVRLTVRAELAFASDDTDEACIAKLQAELVKWLSPWPHAALGPRPATYYTRHAIGEFIRHRPYVAAVVRLALRYDHDLAEAGPCYITSAVAHDLRVRPPAPAPPPGAAAVAGRS